MTDQDFDELLAKVVGELNDKQAGLSAVYGMGHFPKWWLDLETETLQFQNGEGKSELVATVVDVGSFVPKSNSWKWAWSNDSLPPAVKAKSLRLRELEDITGFSLFGSAAPVAMGEAMAWEMAAFAVWHLRALGCYRATASNGLLNFLAIVAVDQPN